jgi:hypothetical protein
VAVFRALKPVFSMLSANLDQDNSKVRMVDEANSKKDLMRFAKKVLRRGDFSYKEFDVWREARPVNRSIKTAPTVIRTSQVRILAGLDLRPMKVNGELIQTTPGLPIPKYSHIRKLRDTVANLVKIIGGNPNTVKIMITNEHTDGRTIDDQIFVNASLIDKSPVFWGIVAARELAGLTTKHYYPHIRRMSTLLERLITNKKFVKKIALAKI